MITSNSEEAIYTRFTCPKKSSFFGAGLFSAVELFERVLNRFDWLDKSRTSKKATYILDM